MRATILPLAIILTKAHTIAAFLFIVICSFMIMTTVVIITCLCNI